MFARTHHSWISALPGQTTRAKQPHSLCLIAACAHSPLDQEYYPIAIPRDVLYAVCCFAYEVGNVDRRQWIRAVNFEPVTRSDRTKRLARLQGWQGTFQTGEIKLCRRHGTKRIAFRSRGQVQT